MKIIDRQAFLAMPAGTVFAPFDPYIFGELMIKGDSYENDWVEQSIGDAIESEGSEDRWEKIRAALTTGASIAMDFEDGARNGMFKPNAKFAIFEPSDVRALIDRLQRALVESGSTNFRSMSEAPSHPQAAVVVQCEDGGVGIGTGDHYEGAHWSVCQLGYGEDHHHKPRGWLSIPEHD